MKASSLRSSHHCLTTHSALSKTELIQHCQIISFFSQSWGRNEVATLLPCNRKD